MSPAPAHSPPVSLVEAPQAPLLARPHYAGSGQPSPIVSSLAHVPELLEVAMPFIAGVLAPSSIDARTKELVILRTSALLGCRYCVQAHTVVALDSGVSREEALALRAPEPAEHAFRAERERALLRWVDEVAAGRGSVATELTADLREHVAEPELVELALLVGATVMLNRYCTALELPTAPATLARLAAEGLE